MPGAELVTTIAREIQGAIGPLIASVEEIPRLSAITADKGGGHTAHELDRRAEEVLFQTLKRAEYSGAVYSEESGLVLLGHEPRLIVCDPYCNTTLTFRGIRESAIAVYECTLEGLILAGVIADLQISRLVWSDDRPCAFVTSVNGTSRDGLTSVGTTKQAQCSGVSHVDRAFLVVSMMKRSRRERLPIRLVKDAAMITTIDGAIAAARLALGEIDGFVDVRIGQPSYEALAYWLVAKADGIVSDGHGVPIDFGEIVKNLAQGSVKRQTIVAAATRSLHTDILEKMATNV